MSDLFPYDLDAETRPRMGLIVLQADETIEDEFRVLFDPKEVQLHISRVPSGAALTPETIHAMEAALPTAAGLFPDGAEFEVVAYACTSGTSLIGVDRVAALISGACQTRAVTNPLTAAFAALHATEVKRIGIVSPYTAEIAEALCAQFERAGFAVPATLSFGEEIEAHVARISAGSLVAAATSLAEDPSLDAIFLSCTNLRALGAIARLKKDLSIPVLSSNTALAWHMAQLASVPLKAPGG